MTLFPPNRSHYCDGALCASCCAYVSWACIIIEKNAESVFLSNLKYTSRILTHYPSKYKTNKDGHLSTPTIT